MVSVHHHGFLKVRKFTCRSGSEVQYGSPCQIWCRFTTTIVADDLYFKIRRSRRHVGEFDWPGAWLRADGRASQIEPQSSGVRLWLVLIKLQLLDYTNNNFLKSYAVKELQIMGFALKRQLLGQHTAHILSNRIQGPLNGDIFQWCQVWLLMID